MKLILMRLLNTLIIICILLIALLMKTDKVSIEIGSASFGTRHIEKVVLCLFVFWAIRLLLNFKQRDELKDYRAGDIWYKVIIVAVLLWRGYENYCDWDRVIPGNLLLYMIIEFSIFCTIYFLYRLVKDCFDPITAAFTCFFFLWTYPDTGSVYRYPFLALSLILAYEAIKIPKRGLVIIPLLCLWLTGVAMSFYIPPPIYGNLYEEFELLRISPLLIIIFFLGILNRTLICLSRRVKPWSLDRGWKGGRDSAPRVACRKEPWLLSRGAPFIVIGGIMWIQGYGLLFSFFFPLFVTLCFISCARGLDILLWNRITNRTIFDRNVSLAVVLLLFFGIVRGDIFRVNKLSLGRSLYEWTGLLHEIGEAVSDKDTLYGYAMFCKGGEEESGKYSCFGPYQYFFKGNYEVVFRMKIDSDRKDLPVCLISVSSQGGIKILAKREIKTTDFGGKKGYRDFNLRFNLSELEELEFKVMSYGEVPFWVDVVRVIRYGVRHQKV